MEQLFNLWVKGVFFSWKTILNAYLYCQMQQKLIMKNHVLNCCLRGNWRNVPLSLEY